MPVGIVSGILPQAYRSQIGLSRGQTHQLTLCRAVSICKCTNDSPRREPPEQQWPPPSTPVHPSKLLVSHFLKTLGSVHDSTVKESYRAAAVLTWHVHAYACTLKRVHLCDHIKF